MTRTSHSEHKPRSGGIFRWRFEVKKNRRNKKYVPKPVRTFGFCIDLLGPLRNEEKTKLTLLHRAPFDAMCRGETNADAWKAVRDALRVGYVMADKFVEEWEHRASLLLGLVAVDAAAVYCRNHQKPPEHLILPAARAFDVLDTMRENLTRRELFEAFTKADIEMPKGRFMVYSPDAVAIVRPESHETWKDIENRPALALVNGTVRTGFLSFNEERQALFWHAPLEGITAQITSTLLVLMEKPMRRR